jgi:hypothetical protein
VAKKNFKRSDEYHTTCPAEFIALCRSPVENIPKETIIMDFT